MARIYIFTRFERFWHWAQALLVIGMLVTGFEIHGSYQLLGFEKAHEIHTTALWAYIGLWVFAIFWHLTTGQWRHYIPTMKNLDKIVRFYSVGIFSGEPHPFKPTVERKHNPMQAQTYLGITVVVQPLIWISGLLYLFYNELGAAGYRLDLATIAILHTIGAFMMLAFLIGHLYLITTGHTVFAQIKSMLTGWDDDGDDTPASQTN